jgi:hypothetical protein
MSDLLDATKKAAQAVLAWGEAMAASVAATEAYRQAQAEAMAEDEALTSYMAARNLDHDEERGNHTARWVSPTEVRRAVASALQAKNTSEISLAEAKAVAERALEKVKELA